MVGAKIAITINKRGAKEVFEHFSVVIWDINNLLYLCGGNRELIHLLLKSIPYPFSNIEAEKPVDMIDEILEFVPDTSISSLTEYISQNRIYVTEKYLLPVALRNVAFIISRKGFDHNAAKAALSCLREN